MSQGKLQQLWLGLLLFFLMPPLKAIASERVTIRYHNHRMSMTVAELSEFGRSGQMSSSIQRYFRATEQNPQRMQWALTKEIPINPITLSRTLNSPLGLIFLNPLGEIITTPSNRANIEALRGALVTSALDDNKISLMEIVENYPTDEVQIHGDRILETYKTMAKIINPIKFF
ncbi:alpha/beta hydrolase [Cyanobacterium stanieri LEGE 03274]|uniref:Alpha/beta hydrolase n=1 Tax=Cyanobacterium stanieri LEGE 03274 TaxID=1828756 RepID=A0ABR9V506_9CHRO|nr:alpha/beta hydrolase [Cyanobacterium stanieri]MBE9222975.1 alpha/beta hydrolase [Cyanobacterium stanieri LEGE 03274]